jgi:hypothetical protein
MKEIGKVSLEQKRRIGEKFFRTKRKGWKEGFFRTKMKECGEFLANRNERRGGRFL